MGYDIAFPAAIIILVPGIIFAVLFAQRRRERKRLDFRKGTTYEKPQEEGTAESTIRNERPAADEPS